MAQPSEINTHSFTIVSVYKIQRLTFPKPSSPFDPQLSSIVDVVNRLTLQPKRTIVQGISIVHEKNEMSFLGFRIRRPDRLECPLLRSTSWAKNSQLLVSTSSESRSKSCLSRIRVSPGLCPHHDTVNLRKQQR